MNSHIRGKRRAAPQESKPALRDRYDVIYAPKGAAAEYAELAVNLYEGCRNRCRYCYVPGTLHMDRHTFHSRYGPRKDILARLERDLDDMREAGDKRRVMMCFTCDPYPLAGWRPGDDSITTRAALRLFVRSDVRFAVLTKSGMAGCVDFELYRTGSGGDHYGATLTCMDAALSEVWEPCAALPSLRIGGLQAAADRGIRTWVSFEPVLDPEQVYRLYDATREFVDEYRIGKINHEGAVDCDEAEKAALRAIDWRRFGSEMIERCERDGKAYVIKEALRKYL
jgi:DNA repair photolyase